jgi:hypothetical protein
MIPTAARQGRSWEVFQSFIATSMRAVETGTFNNRFDRHLTMSLLLVDEIGWEQITKTLRAFEHSLLQLAHAEHRAKRSETFTAAFLASSFQAPREKR